MQTLPSVLALCVVLTWSTPAFTAPEGGLGPILDDGARDSREVRVTGSAVLAVVGVTGLVAGSIWAADDEAGQVAPVPLLVLLTGGLAATFGVVGLATTSSLEDLHARWLEDPTAAPEIARALEDQATVARRERITGGVVALLAGVTTLGVATWAGLEIDDPGSAFVSAMTLGLVGSLELGAGLGLLINQSRIEEAVDDLHTWQHLGNPGAGATSSSGAIRLSWPSVHVGTDSVGLTLGGTF